MTKKNEIKKYEEKYWHIPKFGLDIVNALILNELGESNCQIIEQEQVDANSFAVSLVCPIKERS